MIPERGLLLLLGLLLIAFGWLARRIQVRN